MSNLLDNIVAAFFLFVFAVVAIISLQIFNGIAGSGILGGYETAFRGFYTSVNNVAIFIAVGMSLAAVFSGLLIRTHPAFFIVAVVLIFLEFIITPTWVNIYNNIAQSADIATQTALANQTQILQILPLLTALGTLLTILIGMVRE